MSRCGSYRYKYLHSCSTLESYIWSHSSFLSTAKDLVPFVHLRCSVEDVLFYPYERRRKRIQICIQIHMDITCHLQSFFIDVRMNICFIINLSIILVQSYNKKYSNHICVDANRRSDAFALHFIINGNAFFILTELK